MKKIIVIILFVALAVSGAVLLKKRRKAVNEEPIAIHRVSPVKVVVPKVMEVIQITPFLGRLQARNLGSISSKLTARVVDIAVREAQTVHRGDVLIRLDDRDIQASLVALKSKLSAAHSRLNYISSLYDRNQALFAAGGLAQEKLQESAVVQAAAEADVKELEQNISSTTLQLDYSLIQAPFTGIVGTISVRPGELVTPGRVILSLNSMAQKLTFAFSPGSEIRQGQMVLAGTVPLGTIGTIYTEARSGLWVAEVVLSQRLQQPSGTNLSVEVITGKGVGCAVPVQALLHRSDGERIMVSKDGYFQGKRVEVQLLGREYALIEPCEDRPVAVAAESKLALLPTYGKVQLILGKDHE